MHSDATAKALCDKKREWYRGQWTGHLDKISKTHNEWRRGQWPKAMPGITHVPVHHKRPGFALFSAYFIRQQK
jgi:hypothetical protein